MKTWCLNCCIKSSGIRRTLYIAQWSASTCGIDSRSEYVKPETDIHSSLIFLSIESCMWIDLFTKSHKYTIGLMSCERGSHNIHHKSQECYSKHFWATWVRWYGAYPVERNSHWSMMYLYRPNSWHINISPTCCKMLCGQLGIITSLGLRYSWTVK